MSYVERLDAIPAHDDVEEGNQMRSVERIC